MLVHPPPLPRHHHHHQQQQQQLSSGDESKMRLCKWCEMLLVTRAVTCYDYWCHLTRAIMREVDASVECQSFISIILDRGPIHTWLIQATAVHHPHLTDPSDSNLYNNPSIYPCSRLVHNYRPLFVYFDWWTKQKRHSVIIRCIIYLRSVNCEVVNFNWKQFHQLCSTF